MKPWIWGRLLIKCWIIEAKNTYIISFVTWLFATWSTQSIQGSRLVLPWVPQWCYHCCQESWQRELDRMQRGFLHQLGLTDEEAFVCYNFAPLSLRRSIGMLGFLHKRTLGICHPALVQAFPMTAPLLHNRTIDGSALLPVSSNRALYSRSIWPFIHIYNRLSQSMVDHKDVKPFQSHLT